MAVKSQAKEGELSSLLLPFVLGFDSHVLLRVAQ